MKKPNQRNHATEKRQYHGKMPSSEKPRLDLIPLGALVALADRFELGNKKYGKKSWNAFQNADALANEDWIKARAAHVIHHAYIYLMKMEGLIPDDGDDDAAAIMWGGACLRAAQKHQAKRKV